MSPRMLSIMPSDRRGGAEEYAMTIGSAARKSGCDVHFAFPYTEYNQSMIQDSINNNCSCSDLAIAESDVNHLYGEYIQPILELYTKYKPDFVHLILPWPTYGFSTLIASSLAKVPTLATFQLARSNRPLHACKTTVAGLIDRSLIRVSTASYDTRRIISTMFGYPEDSISVIHNGVPVPFTNYDELLCTRRRASSLLREQLNLPADTRILLTVGRLEEQKGYNYLLEAIREVVTDYRNIRFVWLGEGDSRPKLSEELHKYNLRQYVLMEGYKKDVWPYLFGSDFFVFPTLYEGFGFALAEAMAAGLPSIASAVSAIPEFMDTSCGSLVPPADSRALATAITNALKDPEAMIHKSRQAFFSIQNGFTRQQMIDSTLALLRSLGTGGSK